MYHGQAGRGGGKRLNRTTYHMARDPRAAAKLSAMGRQSRPGWRKSRHLRANRRLKLLYKAAPRTATAVRCGNTPDARASARALVARQARATWAAPSRGQYLRHETRRHQSLAGITSIDKPRQTWEDMSSTRPPSPPLPCVAFAGCNALCLATCTCLCGSLPVSHGQTISHPGTSSLLPSFYPPPLFPSGWL